MSVIWQIDQTYNWLRNVAGDGTSVQKKRSARSELRGGCVEPEQRQLENPALSKGARN